ncbi:hypothetical protein, partial [Ornithobacterium rhinotracheale]
NFGFILWIQYSVASHKLAPLFFIFKSNGKLLAKANRQVILRYKLCVCVCVYTFSRTKQEKVVKLIIINYILYTLFHKSAAKL